MFTSPPGGATPSKDLDDDPANLAKNDPLATQVWRMYAKQRDQLPNAARMENLTWRLMSLTLRRQRGQNATPADAPADVPANAPANAPATRTPTPPRRTDADAEDAAAETRRGRNQTVRPLDGGLSMRQVAAMQDARRAGPRSRSRLLSMMDVDRSSLYRSHSRKRSLNDASWSAGADHALDAGAPMLDASMNLADAAFDSAAWLASSVGPSEAHVGLEAMPSQPAPTLEQLYAPLGAAPTFATPSPQSSVAESQPSAAAPRADSRERLRTAFEQAAFNNLFDNAEAHAWTAASPLEQHAHYVMEMSARRPQMPRDRDDQLLAQTLHLDSVPGIDDYVSHEANQHPEYGFLPRLVRKTSFDHKVRERSESRGPRHRNLMHEQQRGAWHGNARKRPFRDGSPMPFGLRAPTTADQRVASGLSREMPALFSTDMMQYMPSISFDFTVPPPSAQQVAPGTADLMARASPMLLHDPKPKDVEGAPFPAVPELAEPAKSAAYPSMFFPETSPVLPDSLAGQNVPPSFMHVDPSQLLAPSPQPPAQPAPTQPTPAPRTPNLALFPGETPLDASLRSPYGFADAPHVPPSALELGALPTSPAPALTSPSAQDTFYTSVFQPVDMTRGKTWTPGALPPKSPHIESGDGLAGGLARSSLSEPNEQQHAYGTPSSPQGAAPGPEAQGAPPAKAPAPAAAEGTPTVCFNCQTTKTPLWRRDNEGNALCNACGLFQRLHGVMRPLSLKTDVIKKRNRTGTTGARDAARQRAAAQRRSSGSAASRAQFRAASKPDEGATSSSTAPPALAGAPRAGP